MASSFSHNRELAIQILRQLYQACDMIMTWNKYVTNIDDYLTSPEGMEKMAASCMLIENIGEGVKKIDRIMPDFLSNAEPNVPWREIKGLRDHIAHGYFDLDASVIFDVAINEIPKLKKVFKRLQNSISEGLN